MATRKKPAKRKPAARKTSAVRQAGLTDIRRWWKRKTRRARKRIAKKLHLTTTTKKMRPTPPPKQRATPAGPGLRTLGGKTVNTTPAPRARATAQPTGKAAPMSQRVKRKGGKFNGSTAAKKTTGGKKTVAPNPEQQRLLAANKKAAQIDARLARTEQRIDRMVAEPSDQPKQSAAESPQPTGTPPSKPRKPREPRAGTPRVTNVNNGGTVGIQRDHVVGETVHMTTEHHAPPTTVRPSQAQPRKPIGIQAGHIDETSAVYIDGRRVPTEKKGQ